MFNYSFGTLIAMERERAGVTLRDLAQGICSFQMLSKIETNQCDMDKLFADVLLQRLGRSPDKLECILSREEYKKIKARDLIEKLILSGKGEKADYLLEKYYTSIETKDSVSQMYYHRTKAYIAIRCENDVAKAVNNIKNALDDTVLNWDSFKWSKLLLSTYEMENLLFYGKMMFLQGKVDEAKHVLKECLNYIEEHFRDEEERAKIYPKCVWLIAKIYQEEEEESYVLDLCEGAIDLLRKHAITYFMIPLMEEVIRRYQKTGKYEKVEYWQQYYNALNYLYENYATDMCLDSLFYNCYQHEYHLDYEIIRAERLAQGYTQEELIDGIYKHPVSISNLENGKSAPTKRNLEKLMKKLHIDKSRYNGMVATNSFEVLELRKAITAAFGRFKYEDAYEQVQNIKKKISLSTNENRRVIEAYEINLMTRMNKLSVKEARDRLQSLLYETYDTEKKTVHRAPFNAESLIINSICIMYGKESMFEEGISLYEKVLRGYSQSAVDCKHHCRQYELLLANYMSFLLENKEFENALSVCQKAIVFGVQCGKGGALRIFLRGLAQLQSGEQRKEDASMLFQYSVLLAKLFYNEHAAKVSQNIEKKILGD